MYQMAAASRLRSTPSEMRASLGNGVLIAALSALAFTTVPAVAEELSMVIPSLSLTREGDMLSVAAYVSGPPAQTVQATLVINKSGGGGTMNTSQSREITFTSVEQVQVAETGLSFGKDAQLLVELAVEVEGVVVARSQTSIGHIP